MLMRARIVDVFDLGAEGVVITFGADKRMRSHMGVGTIVSIVDRDGNATPRKVVRCGIIGRTEFETGEGLKNIGVVLEGIESVEDVPDDAIVRID